MAMFYFKLTKRRTFIEVVPIAFLHSQTDNQEQNNVSLQQIIMETPKKSNRVRAKVPRFMLTCEAGFPSRRRKLEVRTPRMEKIQAESCRTKCWQEI